VHAAVGSAASWRRAVRIVILRTMADEYTTPDLEELARRTWEYYRDRDWDRLMSFFSPESVVVGTGLGSYEGPTAIRGYFQDWRSPYEDFGVQVENVEALGEGVTLSVVRVEGRPIGSSRYVELRNACVMEWNGSIATRTRYYADVDKARAYAEQLAEKRR
jgi:hypothetical protein